MLIFGGLAKARIVLAALLLAVTCLLLPSVAHAQAPALTLSINDRSAPETNGGLTNLNFTVSLSAPAPVGGVRFDIATANGTAIAGTDYIAQSLTNLTLVEGQSFRTFTVQIVGDI